MQRDTTSDLQGGDTRGGGISRRRFLAQAGAAGLGGVTLASLLAACGGSGGGGETAAGDTGAAGAGSTAVGSGEPVTLMYWTWSHVTAVPGYEENDIIKTAFETANPDVRLEVRTFAYPDYLTALKTAVPGGSAGDVVDLQAGSLLRQYSQFMKPLNEPLTERLGADWESNYVRAALDLTLRSAPDGTTFYGVPIQLNVLGVQWYNTALFEAAGVVIPQTYDELKDSAARLRETDAIPVAWGAKDQWPNTDYLIVYASQYLDDAVEKAELGEIPFTDPAIVNGLAFMKQTLDDDIYNAGPFGTTTYPQANGFFQDQQAAMYNTGLHSAFMGLVAPVIQENARAFLFPHIPGAPDDDWLADLASGSPTQTGASPSRPIFDVSIVTSMRNDLDPAKEDAALRFVQFVLSREEQELVSFFRAPTYVGASITGYDNAGFSEMLDWHLSLADSGNRREFEYPETRAALQTAIEQVCVNDREPAAELARVDEAAASAREKADG